MTVNIRGKPQISRPHRVDPRKYAQGLVVLHFHLAISFMLTSLALGQSYHCLGQSYDFQSTCEVTMTDIDKVEYSIPNIGNGIFLMCIILGMFGIVCHNT